MIKVLFIKHIHCRGSCKRLVNTSINNYSPLSEGLIRFICFMESLLGIYRILYFGQGPV